MIEWLISFFMQEQYLVDVNIPDEAVVNADFSESIWNAVAGIVERIEKNDIKRADFERI